MSNGTGDDGKVNAQILDAVTQSTQFLGLGASPPSATASGAIAFAKAAQAAALSVQDATDYQRNIMSISTVAQGKALAMMFADEAKIEQYAMIFVLAAVAPMAAALTAAVVCEAEAVTVGSFKTNIDS